MSTPTVTLMPGGSKLLRKNHHHFIDEAAEAEGNAIDRLAEYTDRSSPQTRLQIERAYVIAALNRGLPIRRRRWCYAKIKAVLRWIQIVERIEAGHPLIKYRRTIDTIEDREKRELRRPAPGVTPVHPRIAARATSLKQRLLAGKLALLEDTAILDIPCAAQISGYAQRTLYKAVKRGQLPTIQVLRKSGPALCVQAVALRQFISKTIAAA